jgi:hypothetical protein
MHFSCKASGSNFFFFTNASYWFVSSTTLLVTTFSFPFLSFTTPSCPPSTFRLGGTAVRSGEQAKTFGGCHRWARGKVRTSFISPFLFPYPSSNPNLLYIAEGKQQAVVASATGRQRHQDGCYPASECVGLSCDLCWVVF